MNDVFCGGDYILAAKHILQLIIGRNRTNAHLNTDVCTCTSVFLKNVPMCGDLAYLHGNLSLVMPFCEITKIYLNTVEHH